MACLGPGLQLLRDRPITITTMLSRPTLIRSLASLTAVLLLASACGSDDQDTATEDGATETAAECDYPTSAQPAAKEVSAPPATPEVSGTIPITIATNVGDINAELDADAAACTVNSIASLAEQGYFENTTCHRLTTAGIFVLQCGDPTGAGSGGPGYTFDDELSGDEQYGAGTLAMANAGPNTNGSQFFIVYGDSTLPPTYNVFGQLDEESLATVTELAQQGTKNGQPDGQPKEPVEISGVTVG